MKLLITLKSPKKLTSDFRQSGAKGVFGMHQSDASLIILIQLQYIFNSSLYIIQFTNGYALPNFTNGYGYPFGTNGYGYTKSALRIGVTVSSTNGYALPKSQNPFPNAPEVDPHPRFLFPFSFRATQRKIAIEPPHYGHLIFLLSLL